MRFEYRRCRQHQAYYQGIPCSEVHTTQAMPRASLCVQQSPCVSVHTCMHAGQSQLEGTDKSEAMSTISTSDRGEAMSTISTSDHGEHIHARSVHRAKCGHQNTRTPEHQNTRTPGHQDTTTLPVHKLHCLRCDLCDAVGIPGVEHLVHLVLAPPHPAQRAGARAALARGHLPSVVLLPEISRRRDGGVTLHEASSWLACV